jgi:hypothetical protein
LRGFLVLDLLCLLLFVGTDCKSALSVHEIFTVFPSDRVSPNVDTEDLQKFLNYARYKELTANFKVSQNQVDDLVSQIKNDWKTDIKNIGS